MTGAVRPAAVADAEALARVHVAAWQHGYRGLLPAALLDALSVEQRTERWRAQLSGEPAARTWVTGEPVAGFASAGPSRDEDAAAGTGELYALYVHPDAWGRGIGGRLMATALEALGDGATLWVLEGNERARRFYARHGWQRDGAHRQEVRGTAVLDEVRYRLER